MPNVPYIGPPDSNWGGTVRRPPKGMVCHTAEGSYQGTIGWQQNPVSDVSSHFVTAQAGQYGQMLDLDVAAWTQADGNPDWISVENEGNHLTAWTSGQIEAMAQIFAFLRRTWPSIPNQLTNSPSVGGLGWHGMGGVAWGNHPDCPGDVNRALLPVILNRATIINGGSGGVPLMAQMLVRFADAPAEAGGASQVWLCDGMFRRKVPAALASGDSVTDGGIGNNGTHTAGNLGNLGNAGKTFVSGPGGWAGRDAWGMDVADLGGGGSAKFIPHTHDTDEGTPS
jgi:hypothetical protein